jgi:hypothetical protein
MARHGRRRWALWLRRGTMMPQPAPALQLASGSETYIPKSVNRVVGGTPNASVLSSASPGRAHCLQRAPNSSTVVDRCLGAQSTCGEIAGPLTRGAPFRRREKLIAIGKLLAVEGSQDKVNFVRASRRLQEVVCTLFFAARSYPIGGRAIAISRANANSIVGRHFRPKSHRMPRHCGPTGV